jgi:hypothetical protein
MQLLLQVIGMDIDTPRDQPLAPEIDPFMVKLVLEDTRDDATVNADSTGKMPRGSNDPRIGQKMRVHI